MIITGMKITKVEETENENETTDLTLTLENGIVLHICANKNTLIPSLYLDGSYCGGVLENSEVENDKS